MIRATERRRINPTKPLHGVLLRIAVTPTWSQRDEISQRRVVFAFLAFLL